MSNPMKSEIAMHASKRALADLRRELPIEVRTQESAQALADATIEFVSAPCATPVAAYNLLIGLIVTSYNRGRMDARSAKQ